jgi:peptidoglycan/LPS O-acetylase OafA/YrhL
MHDLDKKPGTHIGQVDYIRAIASCAVAIFHLGGKALPGLSYGWLGVHMFFLLSGFIICWSIPLSYSFNNFGTFLAKRFVRIEPPYLVSIILALASHFFWKKNYQVSWPDLLGHFAYLNNFNGRPYLSPVYWTLGIEFQFYIFIAFCFPFLVKKWGIWLLPLICSIPLFTRLQGGLLINLFPLFALGILYYLYLKGIKKIKETCLFGIIITGFGVYLLGWLIAATGLFALLILVLPLKGNVIINFLSKISFSLYLTHDMIGSNVVVFMTMHLPKTFLYKGLSFITGIVVSLLVAIAFYKLVEAPCLRLSRKYRYARQPGHAVSTQA